MKQKSITLIISAVLLLILVAFQLVSSVLGSGLGMAGGGGMVINGRQLRNVPPGGRQALPDGRQAPPEGRTEIQPGNGENRQFRPGFPGGMQGNNGMIQVIRTVTMVCTGAWVLAGLAGTIGLFLRKRWGITLAVMTAVGAVIITIPNLLPLFSGRMQVFMSPLMFFQVGGKLLLAMAITVLALLPATRKACA